MSAPVPFDVATLLAALPSEMTIGAVLSGDWRLEDVYFARDDAIQFQIGRGRDRGRSVGVLVMPRDEARPAYKRTPHFNIVHLAPHGDSSALDLNGKLALERLAKALVAVDTPARAWLFPAKGRADATEYDAREPPSFNLSIESPCESECSFCSIKVLQSSTDAFDEREFQRLKSDLEEGRRGGVTHLRINGIEPLAYPRIVDLARHATALGYTSVDVFTTARPLRKRELAAEFLGALPHRRILYVPLYGGTASVHDAVTGHPGSFDEVMQALDNLAALGATGDVRVEAVVLRSNVRALDALRALCASRGLFFGVHLPYPNVGGSNDKYRSVSVRFSDAVDVLHALETPIPVREAPPCVLVRHEAATGIPSRSKIVPGQTLLVGLAYRSKRYRHSGGDGLVAVTPSLPCPHASSCSLASECVREVYRAYVEQYGWDEFAPPAAGRT